MVGKYWRQGQDAAGHVTSTIRREMNADAQFMVSFSFNLGPQPRGGAAYNEGGSFHFLLTHSRKAPTDMPEVCSQVILSS